MKNWIKLERARHDMNQQQLANAISVTRGTIVSIEKGYSAPSIKLAMRIAAFFNKTIEDMFVLEDHDMGR